MADKKGQKKDAKSTEKQHIPGQTLSSKPTLSDAYLDKIKESFSGFNKISQEERVELYGDRKFLDQFRLYFKEQHPNVLDQIDREDLPLYLQALEKKGFSIGSILKDAENLREEFKANDTEEHVIKTSLKTFKNFCSDGINNMPGDAFEKFAKHAGFDVDNFEINPDGRIKTIDDLYLVWKKFAENENLPLKDLQASNVEKILNPEFNPIERSMVNVALRKIRKEVSGPLRVAFDAKFGTEVTIFSKVQNLVAFKNEWLSFLDIHKGEIDEKLAKNLDKIIVTNGDIKNELTKSGRKFDDTKGFSEGEQYFRIIFNKLASRQLFEEVKSTQDAVDYYSDTIIDAMKGFPPYVNEIFKLYPFDIQFIPESTDKLGVINTKISEAENKIVEGTPDQTKIMLRSEIKSLKEQKEKIRRNAYIAQLELKDSNVAGVMRSLVDSKFDFSQLHMGQQQTLVDVLVKHKLSDLIKRKAPELLSTDEDELKIFLDDLFDLGKTDVYLPTSDGNLHIKFSSGGKKFLGTGMKSLASPEELSELKNLPLNFEVQVTPSSEKFFEDGVIFHSIFDEFEASNGTKKLNDAYKVRITKDDKTAEGYLSLYSPREDGKQWDQNSGSNEIKRYLYSSPVTTASDDRSLVTRPGTDQAVALLDADEKNYAVDILDKKINLNGEALGALFAGFVLGQQSLERRLSPKEEEERREKFAKLKTYQDINQDVSDSEQLTTNNEQGSVKLAESKEKSDIDQFLEAWQKIPGFKCEGIDRKGFKEGAKFIIKSGDTGLPPEETGGGTWMRLEIAYVDRNTGKFTVKVRGGETGLGNLEGVKKTLPMNAKTIDNIVDALGDMDKSIFKMPSSKGKSMDDVIASMKNSGFGANIFTSAFDKISWTGDGFKINLGEKFVGEKVAFFGYDEKQYSSDSDGRTGEKAVPVYYKVVYNPNGTVTITNATDFVDSETKKKFNYKQTMDYAMFVLFVGDKGLHPKPSEDVMKSGKLKAEGPDEGHKQSRPWFSINNVIGFFTSSVSKISDGIKKHDEERTEDLTDIMLNNGLLFEKLGKGIGKVFDRVGNGLERAGLDYYTARDSRVWKKIERRQKMYEADAHFSSLFPNKLKLMVNGKERPKDMYKIPAMLLAIINKEKTPYSRSYEFIGKGHRVNLILGKEHQERYLTRLNAIIEDIRQNSEAYGSDWTVFRNEAMVKFEMKYLIDVIDGREHSVSTPHEYLQAAKRSREFASKLDESMQKNFGFSSIESKNKEISKNTRFEFAEYEYQRHIRTGRTMSAFPFFKTMAEQAQTPKQWNIFHMYAVSGILSGLFRYNLDATTKGWLKDIFRTSGILSGLWAKDPAQQSKMLRMLQIYTNGKFLKEFEYNTEPDPKKSEKCKKFDLKDFTIGSMQNVPFFVRGGRHSFKTRWLDEGNGEGFAKFLAFESGSGVEKKNGKSRETQKTIVELASDEKTLPEDKALLNSYLGFAQEKSEDIDMDIRHNMSAMKLRPWAKSETVVKSLMEYEHGEFKGKDSHEQAGPIFFRNSVRSLIPQHKTDAANVTFILAKFFNWFARVGFEGNERSEFVKRLVAIRQMFREGDPSLQKQAEHTLWYTINGTIIRNNSSGKDSPPEAFLKALQAFNEFFKTNIDVILEPSMIAGSFGLQYVNDLEPGLVKVGDWREYIETKDASTSQGLPPEERQRLAKIRGKYTRGSKYINAELYSIAQNLEDRNGITNELDDYFDPDAHTNTRADLATTFSTNGGGSGSKNTGVKVKNLNTVQTGLIDNLGDTSGQKKMLVDDDDEETYLY